MMKTFWEYLHNEQIDAPIVAGETPEVKRETPSPEVSNVPAPTTEPVGMPQMPEQGFKPKIKPWKAKKSQDRKSTRLNSSHT